MISDAGFPLSRIQTHPSRHGEIRLFDFCRRRAASGKNFCNLPNSPKCGRRSVEMCHLNLSPLDWFRDAAPGLCQWVERGAAGESESVIANGQDLLQNLGKLKAAFVDRYERYTRSGAVTAVAAAARAAGVPVPAPVSVTLAASSSASSLSQQAPAPVPASFACPNSNSGSGKYAYPTSAGVSFPQPAHDATTNINANTAPAASYAPSYTSHSNTSSPASYAGPSATSNYGGLELRWVECGWEYELPERLLCSRSHLFRLECLPDKRLQPDFDTIHQHASLDLQQRLCPRHPRDGPDVPPPDLRLWLVV
ncbi:hypothetical protein B0H17DRAFT_1223346 [Mycena rosella]|uniref:Uncharacterized protein n=1 Tax=Mycena rosella TaxID=1033263 RepID=A0AAD7H1R5_MYCRO|nr:hypothetical protein B0H17DRAFT_1223346 [Mycena rosella]